MEFNETERLVSYKVRYLCCFCFLDKLVFICHNWLDIFQTHYLLYKCVHKHKIIYCELNILRHCKYMFLVWYYNETKTHWLLEKTIQVFSFYHSIVCTCTVWNEITFLLNHYLYYNILNNSCCCLTRNVHINFLIQLYRNHFSIHFCNQTFGENSLLRFLPFVSCVAYQTIVHAKLIVWKSFDCKLQLQCTIYQFSIPHRKLKRVLHFYLLQNFQSHFAEIKLAMSYAPYY